MSLPLVEPLALLHGHAAEVAVAAGKAAWLAGGPAAFALGRVVGDPAIRPVRDLPPDAVARISQAPPPWAGLPTGRPLVMGVINVTPDSFSDGGLHAATERAIAAGHAMAAAGADLVDVGGESTRPGAQPTPPAIEQARLLPVVRALAAVGIVVSADTRNAATMAAALDAGARIVNDVSALAYDPESLPTVIARRCPVVLMHMRGVPSTMQGLAHYDDVAVDVTGELAASLAAAAAAGIARANVALDPGIGFAKGPGHNEQLLARLPLLLNLGCRVLVGVSRKGFIGRLSGEAVARRRLPGSLAAGLAAALGGAAILRVHDVPETVQALAVWHGIFAPPVLRLGNTSP
jgi:dihydropteroate synthase